jgi:hypothetical protein
MAVKDFDLEDPFDLVGKPVPIEEGHDNIEEMTRCVIEEYLSMGWSGKVIIRMFKNPIYTGPHTIYKARGEEYVLRMIEEAKEKHAALMQRLFGNSVQQEV